MRQQKRPLVRFTKQAVSGIVNHFFPVLSDLLYVKRRTAKKPFSMCRFFFLVSGFCRLYKRKGFHCQGTEESIFLLLGNGSGGRPIVLLRGTQFRYQTFLTILCFSFSAAIKALFFGSGSTIFLHH